MKLFVFIAKTLGLSRKEAKSLIKNSFNLFVNDKVEKDPNYLLEEKDKVSYQSKELNYQKNHYLLLNKPKGYICSLKDELYPSILNLIEDQVLRQKLRIVGRLDVDTEGLIILTDDGDFIHEMTSPNKDILKKYYVEADFDYTEQDILLFSKGVVIHDNKKLDYKTKEALLEIIDKNKAYVTISEGRFHQIKKMHKAIGKEVLFLKRVSIGGYSLGNLKTGEYIHFDCLEKNEEELWKKENYF